MQTLEEKSVTHLKRNKLVIICSKGSLDMAYPPLMLATTAAAMGMDVHLYFTFWGMNMITKKTIDSLKISPVGNPALPSSPQTTSYHQSTGSGGSTNTTGALTVPSRWAPARHLSSSDPTTCRLRRLNLHEYDTQ